MAITHEELVRRLGTYRFYHTIDLGRGIKTPGNPVYVPTQNMVLEELRKLDLRGRRVLDVGCRDGLFCFEAERLGAGEVIGIDNNISGPATELLIPYLRSRVRMFEMNVLDVRPEWKGRFDVIVFAGVLYHMRYPMWTLRLLRDVLADGGVLILETGLWRGEERYPMLYCPVDTSPYEPTSCTFFNANGLCTTLRSLGIAVRSQRYLHQGARWRLMQMALGWSRRLRRHPTHAAIDRGVFVCERNPAAAPADLARYWDSTHDFHTRHGG